MRIFWNAVLGMVACFRDIESLFSRLKVNFMVCELSR